MLQAAIQDPERLALVRRLALRSIIIAPLRARGRTFGTLTIANTAGNRLFDQSDVQLAEDLARLVAAIRSSPTDYGRVGEYLCGA